MENEFKNKLYNYSNGNLNEDQLFEQYKIYVQDAQRTSDRRAQMNNFHLGVLGTIFAVSSFLSSNVVDSITFLLDIFGIIFSASWLIQLNYYKELNGAKFNVINEIEKKFAVNGFEVEWKIFKSKTYMGLTASRLEKSLPFAIGILFLVLLVVHIIA